QPKVVVDIGNPGFISGRWHSLIISHKRSSPLLFNKDYLEVFLDEELFFRAPVPYPRHVSEPLSQCSVGWDFNGQMSGVFFLSIAAELKIVKSMLCRLMGLPDSTNEDAHGFGSCPPDLDLWDDTATVSAQQRLRRKLLGSKYRIFAAFFPDRTVNGLCLEPHNGLHALLRVGTTHVWLSHTCQDVVKSIGGTPTLLSLAQELLSNDLASPPGSQISNPFSDRNVDTVLSVLLSFLDGNVANQVDFYFAGGMEILELLLHSAPKRNFALAGAHTVMVLESIFQACQSLNLPATIEKTLPGLAEGAYILQAGLVSFEHQILVCLLTNFPLWVRAPTEFQFGLVTSILDMVRSAPDMLQQVLPLDTILASVRVCCPDKIPLESDQTLEDNGHDAPGFMDSETASESSADMYERTSSMDQDWRSMSRRERLHMRGYLWEVLRVLLEREVRQQDGHALVHFLASCDDTRLVCELVQILGLMMRKSVPPAGLFWALETASRSYEGRENECQGAKADRNRIPPHTGFINLVLERCVLVNSASEDLRVAGLRVVNVFMARSAKAKGLDVATAAGESMHSKVSSVFPLLSEGLVRDRHVLGEGSYAALLEMALLCDERDLPWSRQDRVAGIGDGSSRSRRPTISTLESAGTPRSGRSSTEDEVLTASVWWDCDSQSTHVDGRSGGVLDDAQLIRNVLPLALVLQYLPTMAKSVQERSHGDLLLMLKLNKANRQKVMELSHVNGGKFYGVWERCMFLMMAPLFTRYALVADCRAQLDEQNRENQQRVRKGDYFMVLRLYAILLEHAMSVDENGYKEIAVAASLQHLIPHGRIAVRVLLAQLAFEVGQNPEFSAPILGAESSSDSSSDAGVSECVRMEIPQQPRWNNMVHLAFIAANVVSDDVSTVTLGLFPGGEDVGKGANKPGEESILSGDVEAIQASAASRSIPFLLCSSPAGHSSLALSARILGMFGVMSARSSVALVELCTARSGISGQGPLMFPLLRLSVFLLVRLHPFTRPAQENLQRLASLVQCLLSDDWRLKEKDHCRDSDDMCIVVLAHVHAALVRLKTQATRVGGISHKLIYEARQAVASKTFVPPPALDATAAYEYGRALLGLLRFLSLCRRNLLSKRLGVRLYSAIQKATALDPQDAFGTPETVNAAHALEQHFDQARRCWDHLLASLAWMEGSFIFPCAEDPTTHACDGVADLLEACMPSLKAAEELETRAVREAGQRTRQWRELDNRSAGCSPSDNGGLATGDTATNKILDALKQEALKAYVLRKVKKKRRLRASRRRLDSCLRTLSAAWSPWASGCPPGWEIKNHRDQLMRQMLLVPVNRDVTHKEAAYAGTRWRSDDTSDVLATNGEARRDASLVSGLKPSASLLAGKVDDDEEETDGEAEFVNRPAAVTFGLGGSDEEPTESWEDITHPSALQAEIDVAAQSAASQQEWEDIQPMLSSRGGLRGRVCQGLLGKWRATRVLREGSLYGVLYLFQESLVFTSEEATEAWRLERLTQLHLRRYLLQPQAVELFWADSPEVFLAFQGISERQAFTRNLRRRRLPMLPVPTRQGILHPRKVLKACGLTELWRRRQLSNFQYIMELNVIAGRSYNDISQYPVFPWVLADYTSSELDLNKPSSFRDLSKPMGALNERRRQQFLKRYATFEDDMVPEFMYGTHYSSAGVVLHYLVRQDPFTSLHINLQGGRFDCPDRLFQDLGQSWKGCIDENNMSDVKELTPEFFFCPDILLNSNKLPLGEMQDERGTVHDVRLPPWAKDAFDFVRIHRLALESEQVSQHLHHWIDLVFGYQQRGQEAVKATNVFYYLTYEGAVDLSLVKDDCQRDAMEAQIRHFGQTPSQVLKEPHPNRLPPEECILPIFSQASAMASLRVFSAGNRPREPFRRAALLVYCTQDRLVSIDAALRVTTWTWSGVPDGFGLPFTLGHCRTTVLRSSSLHMSPVTVQTSAPSARVPMTARSPGHGDQDTNPVSTTAPRTEVQEETTASTMASFKGTTAPSNSVADLAPSGERRTSRIAARSIGRVHSCFGVCTVSPGNFESILSCGYWDKIVRQHRVNSAVKLSLEGFGTGGHQDAITCLAIAQESSLMVTGGQDATCRVWVVGNGPMASALGGTRACSVDITKGLSSTDSMVCVHALYGHEAPITCIAVSEELDAVVSGASDGRIVLHCLKDGCYVRQYRCGLHVTTDAGATIPEASQLAFSCHGDVVVHSWTDLSLHRFSLNGTRLATAVVPTVMTCLLTAGAGEYLLAGGQDGLIRVY
ncbi:unnamed protein product, partial [Hapterophycus canaliculatus]